MPPSSEPSPLGDQFAGCLARLAPGLSPAVLAAARLVSEAVGEGHVCIDLADRAGGDIDGTFRLPQLADWKTELLDSPVVGWPGDFRPLIVDGDRLYLARYWNYEKRLADWVLAQCAVDGHRAVPSQLDADLDRLFPNTAGRPDRQRAAAATAVSRRFCVISGGPGTGKTTTVVRILAALQMQAERPLRIALAAPTGKAAARLSESIRLQKSALNVPEEARAAIPDSAATLHRLLGSRPDSIHFRHHRDNPLPVDVVIVDEASMVDLALMAKLMDALPKTARLILLGDKDQLSAVEAGAVFADLCAGDGSCGALADAVALLTESHRFGADSGIGAFAGAVNAGAADAGVDLLRSGGHGDLAWRVAGIDDGRDALMQRMESAYEDYFEAVRQQAPADDLLRRFNRFRVLTAHRDGPAGASVVNRLFEERQRHRLGVPASARWYPGRPVIVTRNDYGLKLFNGDVGVCVGQDGELRVCFEDAERGIRSFAPGRLPDHQTVYAMTVHKSQGSEFDDIALVLPDVPSPVLTRSLVYTAVTRARSSAEIWGTEAVLRAAIASQPRRSGGLRDRLGSGPVMGPVA